MLFKEIGNKELPTIFLLHGGGLSDWSLRCVVCELQKNYHIVTVIIDGHGEDGCTEFQSISDSAQKLISYIKEAYNGKIFAIAGLSIGAQIICEALSLQGDISQYAIIESSLLYPIKGTSTLTVPMYRLFYGLLKKRWFAKMQAKTLCVPTELFENYYQDSLRISKQSLINITLSNGNYPLKSEIAQTSASVLIIVGQKELGIMRKSAALLHQTISNSQLFIAPKMKHGELSLVYSNEYLNVLTEFFRTDIK